MKRILPFLLLSLFAVGTTSCGGDSHEAVAKQIGKVNQELVDVLKGVTDEDSAKKAASKIEALGEKMKTIQEKAEKLGEPSSKEMEEKLVELAGGEEFAKSMMEEMMRVMEIPGAGPVLQEAMAGLDQ